MIVRAQGRTDQARAVERTTMVAVAAMERWRRTVRALPLLVETDEFRVALSGLSAWYERLCVDDEYAMPGPSDGIDALQYTAQLITEPPSEALIAAWWAVRLAQEVVECRRFLGSTDDVEEMDLEVALARLEVALHGRDECLNRVPA